MAGRGSGHGQAEYIIDTVHTVPPVISLLVLRTQEGERLRYP